jgi:hypothetical protein
LVDAYKARTFCEDLELIEELGGEDGILNGLHTDPSNGINSLSKPERDACYDSNYKAPPEPTPFCDFIWETL